MNQKFQCYTDALRVTKHCLDSAYRWQHKKLVYWVCCW